MGALKELQDEGKIRHIGVSNVSLDELERARELVDVVTVQNRYNLEDRHSEDVLDACTEAGIGFIPWFPLATGGLARPGGPLDDVARSHDATPGQVALAWLLGRSEVMLPIPGTASVAHLEENVAAARARARRGRARPHRRRGLASVQNDDGRDPRAAAVIRRFLFEGLRRVAQRGHRLLAREALEGTVLELADTLARESEAATGLA